MTATETIYIYNECCTRGGQIFGGTTEEAEENDDLFWWGEGSREELLREAVDQLAIPCNRAPHFRQRCAKSVMRMLDGPEMTIVMTPRGVTEVPVEPAEGEPRWWKISGDNLPPRYGFGTADEAELYARLLNRESDNNLFSALPADAVTANDLDGFRDDGFDIADELSEVKQ